MRKKLYDIIIVGSGAGGSTLAYELSKKGNSVLIIEKGPIFMQRHAGRFWSAIPRYYAKFALRRSKEGTMIYSTENVGGTTVFSCGNMVRIPKLEKNFAANGINLDAEFLEAEKTLNVKPLQENKIIAGSKIIMEATRRLGYKMEPTSKGFNSEVSCDLCGNCITGCHKGAKWDGRFYLDKALKQGAVLMSSTEVKKVMFSVNCEAIGVELSCGEIVECQKVILAAGGIGTPIILQSSNISAGNGLFIDPFEITCGIAPDNLSQLKSPAMAAVDTEFHHKNGFILSPFVDHWSQMLIFYDLWWDLIHLFPQSRVLSIMTKIQDERTGKVDVNSKISKCLTDIDQAKLKKGAEISSKILREAGVNKSTIITTAKRSRGAHPGGTSAIGEVVDNNLKVIGCEGLYVCDCSVFPISPGMPPILSIVALAKHLAKIL